MPFAEIPAWENDGFAAPPAKYISNGTEKVMRCYSQSFQDRADNWHGSRQYGNCFWVFKSGVGNGPIANQTINRDLLTADVLEANLNAALWNNTYQSVAVFQMRAGLNYRIGSIGQNTRGTHKTGFTDVKSNAADMRLINTELLTHISSYDYTNPDKILRQVMLEIPYEFKDSSEYLTSALTFIANYAVTGRERYLGDRSTHSRN